MQTIRDTYNTTKYTQVMDRIAGRIPGYELNGWVEGRVHGLVQVSWQPAAGAEGRSCSCMLATDVVGCLCPLPRVTSITGGCQSQRY
jgi:hypothetical protein